MTVAFVAGATGLVGREVVRVLREQGVEVHAHVRPDSSRLEHWRGVHAELGATTDTTAWEADAMTAAIARIQPSVVFGLLGTTQARKKAVAKVGGDADSNSYEAVDYGLTKMVLDATAASAPTARFVYLSAVGADKASGSFMKIRARIEAHLREGSMPWTSARPSFILGDRDEERMGESVGAGLIDVGLGILGLLGARKAKARYGSITGPELAAALVHHGMDPAGADRVFETDELRGF
ncbi:MAG: NAD(P)H-binding protein [Proteobacteria bacterium]|nr:NAD(P)H-binding protein [Pseudomonadota bacterium]